MVSNLTPQQIQQQQMAMKKAEEEIRTLTTPNLLGELYDKKVEESEFKSLKKSLLVNYYLLNRDSSWNENITIQFFNYCTLLDLNPYSNDIFIVKRGGKATITISFKVYLRWAQSDPNYNGVSLERHYRDSEGKLLPNDYQYVVATAYYKNGSTPYTVSLDMTEFKGTTPIWSEKPHYMLDKTAIKLVLEQGFQARQDLTTVQKTMLSGVYTPEELLGIDSNDLTQEQINKMDTTPIIENVEQEEVEIELPQLGE